MRMVSRRSDGPTSVLQDATDCLRESPGVRTGQERIWELRKPWQLNGANVDMLRLQAESDYATAEAMGLVGYDRWAEEDGHHPKSERLMRFLQLHDERDFGNHFDWKLGGDGDNGESVMYQMDAFFELMDKLEGQDAPDACA